MGSRPQSWISLPIPSLQDRPERQQSSLLQDDACLLRAQRPFSAGDLVE
jgi:hypothetical protein